MMYTRYVIGPTHGEMLHGNYHSVSHIWEHGDGTSMFKVECDDLGFNDLNSEALVTVLPSLHAPAQRLTGYIQDLIKKHKITVKADDTLLNILRQLRDIYGSNVLIDSKM